MSNVSFNRVVDVQVNVADRSASVANFSIPLILVGDAGSAGTDLASDLVRTFSSLEELAQYGFSPISPAYLTAEAMLATNNSPRTFKVGYSNGDTGASLQAIAQEDSLFYLVVLAGAQTFASAADLIGANDFLIETGRVALFDVHDAPLLEDPNGADSLGLELQALQPSRLAGFHIDEPAGNVRQHYAAKAAAFISNVNYHQPNSHYTAKFIQLDGALPASVGDTAAQNLTGFIPSTGQNVDAGAHLNTYVCTAGVNYLVEGTMTDGTFIDLVTFSDWLKATLQQNVLNIFTNNRVVPYDVVGVSMIQSAIIQTMESALLSGAITDNRQDGNGDFLPAYDISVQDIASVAPALQAQRIAPNFEYCVRYTGAMHYVDVRGTIKVAN